jgi:gliding motility-associated-like protein
VYYQGELTGETISGLAFNDSGSEGYLSVALIVDYGVPTGEIASQVFADYTKVKVRPDHKVSLTLIDGLENSTCSFDQHDFVIPNKDLNADFEYSLGFESSVSADEKGILSVSKDTLFMINGTNDYLVTATVLNTLNDCEISVSVKAPVIVLPIIEGIFGASSQCEMSNTQRDTAVYYLTGSDAYEVLWKGVNIDDSTVAPQVIIDTNYFDLSNNRLDTIVDIYAQGFDSFNESFLILAEASIDSLGCKKDTILGKIIDIDEVYAVPVNIIPDTSYCEGDTGQFYLDLSKAVIDRDEPFGSKDYHYSKVSWYFNDILFRGDNYDTVVNNGTSSDNRLYSFMLDRKENLDTISKVFYDDALDSLISGYRGEFQLDDQISVLVEPQYCWSKDSLFYDTLDVNAQDKVDINLVINGDKLHFIDDVVEAPLVDLFDAANITGVQGAQYSLGYSEKATDSVIYIGSNLLGIGEFDDVRPPLNYDTVQYFMLMNQGVCESVDSALLVLNKKIHIPTGFTPNQDGDNDTWKIINIDKFPNATVKVYNRWGSLLYETSDYSNNEWDGKYDGNTLPVASYYFIVDLNDGSDVESGAVSIFK